MHAERKLTLLGRTFDGFERSLTSQFAEIEDLPARHRLIEIDELERLVVHGEATKSGEFDLMLLVSDWFPALISDGRLLALDDAFANRAPDGWPDAWVPGMRSLQKGPDGRTYGVAYHDGPMLLLYRTDLYSDVGEQRGFAERFGYRLKPPANWTEFRDQAMWFTRPDDGLYGTVLAGYPDEHNNVYDFLTHLWSRGGDLITPEGRSGLAGAAARSAVDYLHKLWHVDAVVDPAAASWDSVASGIHFANGEAAMMLNWCGFAALSADPESPTHGVIGCAPAPGEDGPGGTAITLNAYWALCVPSGATDPERSIELIRRITSHEMDVKTALAGGSATRIDSWNDPRVQAVAPYYGVLEQAHKHSRSVPDDPRWPRIAGILNAMMDLVVSRDSEPREALAQAHAKLDELLIATGEHALRSKLDRPA